MRGICTVGGLLFKKGNTHTHTSSKIKMLTCSLTFTASIVITLFCKIYKKNDCEWNRDWNREYRLYLSLTFVNFNHILFIACLFLFIPGGSLMELHLGSVVSMTMKNSDFNLIFCCCCCCLSFWGLVFNILCPIHTQLLLTVAPVLVTSRWRTFYLESFSDSRSASVTGINR